MKKFFAIISILAVTLSFACCTPSTPATENDSSVQQESSTVGEAPTTSVDSATDETGSIADDSNIAQPQISLPYRSTIAAGDENSLAIAADGTLYYAGRTPRDFPSAKVVSIDSYNHYLALLEDGTVYAAPVSGSNKREWMYVEEWKDIVAVAAGWTFSAGLKSDGTVVVAGSLPLKGAEKVAEWTDIVAIEAGYFLAGVKSDGTVVLAGVHSSFPDVSGWTDIVAVSTSSSYLMGLKSDGTVVAVSTSSSDPQCDVEDWTNIVAIAAGLNHSVGLKADGTVVTTKITDPKYDLGECNVKDWTDIVAIDAKYNHTVGLKADGTVVATGDNDEEQCDVSAWVNVQLP